MATQGGVLEGTRERADEGGIRGQDRAGRAEGEEGGRRQGGHGLLHYYCQSVTQGLETTVRGT